MLDEAKRTGKSISAVLRDWIDERIRSKRQGPLKRDPLWSMVGISRGGAGKAREEHDKYLSEARRKRKARKIGEAFAFDKHFRQMADVGLVPVPT